MTWVDIKLTTKQHGEEILWTLGTTCFSDKSYSSKRQYSQRCLLTTGVHTLSCNDTGSNGWHGGFLEIQGNRHCQSFTHGSETTSLVTIIGIAIYSHF